MDICMQFYLKFNEISDGPILTLQCKLQFEIDWFKINSYYFTQIHVLTVTNNHSHLVAKRE